MPKGNTNDFRRKYRPYIIAAVAAFVMTMFVAPERHEGSAMEPLLRDGQVIVLKKETFSAKRGHPQLGAVVVLKKGVFPESQEDNPIRRVAGLPGETVEIDGVSVTLESNELFVVADHPPGEDEKIRLIQLSDIRGTAVWIVWPLSDIGGI